VSTAVKKKRNAAPLRAVTGGIQLARLCREGEAWAVELWSSSGHVVPATLHEALDVEVAETALRTGEPMVVVDGASGPVVVGALRTRATPGIDRTRDVTIDCETLNVDADAIALRGRTVRAEASEELALRSRAAFVVLRAAGEIESFADRIVTRAEGVHKLVGRMLRLN
jgi:hypothetical protein